MHRRAFGGVTCLAKGTNFIAAQASWSQRLTGCKIRKLGNSCGTWLDNGDTWPTDGTVCLGRPTQLAARKRKGLTIPSRRESDLGLPASLPHGWGNCLEALSSGRSPELISKNRAAPAVKQEAPR